jgi:hypothetical protein
MSILDSIRINPTLICEMENPSPLAKMVAIQQCSDRVTHERGFNVYYTLDLWVDAKDGEYREPSDPKKRKTVIALRQLKKIVQQFELPEFLLIYAVKIDPRVVYWIKGHVSEKVQLAAVNHNPMALNFIDDPSEEVQLAAVKLCGPIIANINDPSEAVQIAAVQGRGGALKHIKNPSKAVLEASLKYAGWTLYYIKDAPETLQWIAIEQDPESIEFINDPSLAIQLAAVQKDGYAIRYIKTEVSEEVKLAAVKQKGCVIEYIDDPSPEVQMAAIGQSPWAIKYIKRPCETVNWVINDMFRTQKEINVMMDYKYSLQ